MFAMAVHSHKSLILASQEQCHNIGSFVALGK
jgi:hypothetical protein